ncbi:MarR family winged helix-turn-helix transcriptional regulator [Clostridium sp. Marseille-P299]|uniref:MarR family winged helix-turn-helix transcriptional regulator n=1 Tax=Clostridium sp. Marseille-P299 TaxID=1805477 RepID=UPI0008370FB4|nr:MarR family transcriptional regulator [Clostridium sp. Marseille-P299]
MEDQREKALRLENQLCFALYVCSKEIIRKYKPLLEPIGLTYTGYITMLALWEKDNVTVKELGEQLYLDSGTLTPMLKKLEQQGLLKRKRGMDERTVFINLTKEGKELKKEALEFPEKMGCNLNLSLTESQQMLSNLHKIMIELSDK